METLEERADKYIDKNFTRIADEMPICEGMKTIYVESATEQKVIDIEKACRWLVEHSHNSDTQDGITCSSVMTDGTLIEDFRKAMEE